MPCPTSAAALWTSAMAPPGPRKRRAPAPAQASHPAPGGGPPGPGEGAPPRPRRVTNPAAVRDVLVTYREADATLQAFTAGYVAGAAGQRERVAALGWFLGRKRDRRTTPDQLPHRRAPPDHLARGQHPPPGA